MIVVDSSVWIDNIRNSRADHVRRLEEISHQRIIVGDIILLEVLQGARDDLHAEKLRRSFQRFRLVSMLGPNAAVRAAQNHRRLRGLGISVGSVADLVIATYCIENDHELLQNDRDYLPIARHLGLRLVEIRST